MLMIVMDKGLLTDW